MTIKPCLDCGAPTTRTRCTIHEAARQHTRNLKRADRYGQQHKTMRRQWAPVVARGTVHCARCGELIHPGDTWHLDHLPNGASAPSHAYCNTAARRNV